MKSIRKNSFFAVCILLLAFFMMPKSARANRLGPDTIALFPKEVGHFGYADLQKARTLAWFPQLEQQILPDRFKDFEKFLASAGVNPDTQVTELAWGLVAEGMDSKSQAAGSSAVPSGEEIVGIALGNFNPDTADAYFKKQKLPVVKVHGLSLYPYGTGSGAGDLFFLFFDSNKAAFGSRAELEKMVEIRFGGEQGLLYNQTIFPLIDEANNGSGVVWAVLDPSYTRLAMQQLVPQIQQFPDAAKLVNRMKNMIININADSGIDGKFQAVCGSTDDANALAQLLQLGMLYQQYQAKSDNPDVTQLLSQAKVSPAGDRVMVRMSLSNDQMTSLIRHNTFALKM